MTIAIVGMLILGAGATAAVPAHTVLTVTGLECRGCSSRFEKQLAKTAGVLTSRLEAGKRQAAITYDSNTTDAGDIAESLQKAGFAATLSSWEPVSASFKDCSNGFCGLRRPNAEVHAQPGASIGDEVYCPVSGVVLKITAATPKEESGGGATYVCCEGCLRYLRANQARVRALRGGRAAR
jgi:copper chaperone CopZ